MNTNGALNTPAETAAGHAQAKARSADLADDLIVHFGVGLQSLAANEAASLRRWVSGWMAREPDAIVVMACAAPAARAGRVDRLRMLRALLGRHGVATQSVRYTGDLIEAENSVASAADATSGTATLKVMSARRAEREVRSIRSYFVAAARSREVACTSAS